MVVSITATSCSICISMVWAMVFMAAMLLFSMVILWLRTEIKVYTVTMTSAMRTNSRIILLLIFIGVSGWKEYGTIFIIHPFPFPFQCVWTENYKR